ncbi:13701_t:CDS:2, partial [Gigaspora rosea]
MHELLVANKDQVEVIFEEFSESEENGALDWKNYYSKLWHLASLNLHNSNISEKD